MTVQQLLTSSVKQSRPIGTHVLMKHPLTQLGTVHCPAGTKQGPTESPQCLKVTWSKKTTPFGIDEKPGDISGCPKRRGWNKEDRYLVKHVAVDIIQSPELFALCAHELAPVVCWRAIQTPPVTPIIAQSSQGKQALCSSWADCCTGEAVFKVAR